MKLDDRIKELIAVSTSVTANCQPCLKYHIGAAHEAGADEKEIAQTIKVAKTVRKGAASKFDRFASSLSQVAHSDTSISEEACGCSS